MRKEMVILRPHRLKRSMLAVVGTSPGQRARHPSLQMSSNLGANNRYPAKAAMIAVTVMKRLLFGGIWHSHRNTRHLVEQCRRVRSKANFYVRTCLAPDRFSPFADFRHVGRTNESLCANEFSVEQGHGRLIQIIGGLCYFRDRVPEAAPEFVVALHPVPFQAIPRTSAPSHSAPAAGP